MTDSTQETFNSSRTPSKEKYINPSPRELPHTPPPDPAFLPSLLLASPLYHAQTPLT
jgi:hypothetical protein